MKNVIFILAILFFVSGSCYDSKVDRLRLEILEKQLTELENWQQQFNENLIGLQNLVSAFKSGVFIVEITQIPEGYHIILSDGKVLRIRNGIPGDEGKAATVVMPAISVRDSSDGHMYWMIGGALLTDRWGQAVRVDGSVGEAGETGEDGIDGITPRIQISGTTGEWEISLDEGKHWESTGIKATGEKGDRGDSGENGKPGEQGPAGEAGPGIFAEEGVTICETYVEFILADGMTFTIPRYKEWSLQFPEGNTVYLPVNGVRAIPFQLSGSGGTQTVNAVGNQGCQADVRMMEEGGGGEIVIKAPAEACRASVMVFLNDESGNFWTYSLEVIIS